MRSYIDLFSSDPKYNAFIKTWGALFFTLIYFSFLFLFFFRGLPVRTLNLIFWKRKPRKSNKAAVCSFFLQDCYHLGNHAIFLDATWQILTMTDHLQYEYLSPICCSFQLIQGHCSVLHPLSLLHWTHHYIYKNDSFTPENWKHKTFYMYLQDMLHTWTEIKLTFLYSLILFLNITDEAGV